MKDALLKELDFVEETFFRSISCLKEEHSDFRPTPESLTTAHQIAHAAQSIDWFIEGMCRPEGFDLDFEKHWKEVTPITSISAAKEWVSKSINQAKQAVSELSEQQLNEPLPEGPVMGGAPKLAVIGAIAEHTAHHRGALTVYSRLLGLEPTMPYMEI